MKRTRNLLSTRPRKALATFATCAVAGVASLAFAAWLSDSQGDAGGRIGSLTAVTATAVAANDACFPGGSCEGAMSVQNPNSMPLEIWAVQDGLGEFNVAGGGGGNPLCMGGNLSVNGSAVSTPIPLPANTTTTVRVNGLFSLSASAPSSCQSLSFTKGVLVRVRTP